MNKAMNFLGGLGFGVGAMYLLDPDLGARRRALLRDQAARLYQDTQEFLGKAGRDLGNRLRGTSAKDWLETHRDEESMAAPEGAWPRGESGERTQANWSPNLRVLAGIAGAAAMGYVFARKRPATSAPVIQAPTGPHRSPRHPRHF